MLGVDEDDDVSARVATVSSESSKWLHWLALPIALAVSEKSMIEDMIRGMASRQLGW
jgi:hypothetical protein